MPGGVSRMFAAADMAEARRLREKSFSDYPDWTKVTVGETRSTEDLAAKLAAAGVSVSPSAAAMLQMVDCSDQQQELQLVKPTVRDIGFGAPLKEPPKNQEIFRAIEDQGLVRPTAEVAISLLVQQPDLLSSEEWAVVPHTPIDGRFFVLSGRIDTETLTSHTTTPSTPWFYYPSWPMYTPFVFVKIKI